MTHGSSPDRPPLLADRYRLEAVVGQGGMAEIWRAVDVERDETVAIKRLLGGSASEPTKQRERLLREAEALGQLSHPNVVRYFDVGFDTEDRPYLVLEWLEGEDLAQRQQRAPLSLDESVEVVRQVLKGLAACHEQGVVHRDIKPSNVFLVASEGGLAVKVVDFGLARLDQQLTRLTRTGMVLGTLHYMAPEQVRGGEVADHRCDLYGVGVLLYELATGRLPFVADEPTAVMLKIVSDTPPWPRELRPELPQSLEEVILRAIRRAPSDRYGSAGEMLAALSGDKALATGATAVSTVVPGARKSGSRETRLVSLLCVAVADSAVDDAEALFGAVEDAISGFGGVAQRVLGPHLIGLFGLQQTAGDEALRAVRAGLSIESAKRAQLRTLAATLHLEIGAGVHLDAPALDRVTRAIPRLRPGELVIDEATRQLVGDQLVLRPAGRYQRVLRLSDERTTARRRVLGVRTPTVGREQELGGLRALVQRTVAHREAEAALIVGPAGIGKSRLLNEIVAELGQHRALVLLARADSSGPRSAYRTIGEALRSAAQIASGGDGAVAREALQAFAARFFDAGDRTCEGTEIETFLAEAIGLESEASAALQVARSDAKVMREQIVRALVAVLSAASERGPVALCFEDIQWADVESLQLCAVLLERLEDRPLLLLATGREELFARHHQQLFDGIDAVRVELGPLRKRAVSRLVKSILGERFPPEVAPLVAERSGGNPYFAEELVSWMVARDVLVSTEEGWRLHLDRATLELPAGIEGAIQGRLDRLDAPAKDALKAAAVFGDLFWARGCATLLGEANADEALEQLERADFIVAEARSRLAGERQWCFRQSLLQQAAYQMLPADRRAALHRGAGAWLEGAGERDPAVLARHFAEGGDAARAADYHARAATRAYADGDNEQAARYFAAALVEKAASERETIERTLGLARARYRLGRYDDALEALDQIAALAEQDPTLRYRADSLLLRGQLLYGRTRYGEAEAMLTDAESCLDPQIDTERTFEVAHTLFWVIWVQGRYEDSGPVSERLIRAARRSKRPDHLCAAQLAQAYYQLVWGDLGVCLELAEEAVENARSVGHLFREVDALLMLGSARELAGRYDDAGETLAAAEKLATGLRSAHHLAGIELSIGRLRESEGSPAAALTCYLGAIERASALGDHRTQAIALAGKARALRQRGESGDLGEAAEAARRALTLVADRVPPVEAEVRVALAQVYLDCQEAEAAVDEAQLAVALLEQLGAQERCDVEIMLVAHDALKAAGRDGDAEEMLARAGERLEARVGRIAAPSVRDSFGQRPHNARVVRLRANQT